MYRKTAKKLLKFIEKSPTAFQAVTEMAGFALDSFARGPLWAHKINYRCGTGHGVGYISSVHEGDRKSVV